MLVKKKILSDKIIIELASVFRKHNWAIEDSNSTEYSLFDMFCERLEEVDGECNPYLNIKCL